MKPEFPALNQVIKTLLIAPLLALVAWGLYPYLGLDNLAGNVQVALAVLAGVLLGGLVPDFRITASKRTAGNDRIESIFVGNLAFKAPPAALRELFAEYGEVHAVRLMTDRVTRKPRGFGFVEMNRRDAKAAIKALDGYEFYGREIKVNIANERKPREERRAA